MNDDEQGNLPSTPWGELIRDGRRAKLLSVPEAARLAGVSAGQWGHVERGYQSRGRGKPFAKADGMPETVAHMADVAGVSPERLEEAGRPDAARVLREIRAQRAETGGAPAHRFAGDPAKRRIWDDADLTEAEKLGAIAGIDAIRAADAARRPA